MAPTAPSGEHLPDVRLSLHPVSFCDKRVAAALSLLLFFVTTGGEKNLIQEIGKTNWAPVVMGLSVVGLELGYILIYRAGWKVSVASLVANLALACILVLVGVLWYKEVLTGHQILGIGACVVGILLISR